MGQKRKHTGNDAAGPRKSLKMVTNQSATKRKTAIYNVQLLRPLLQEAARRRVPPPAVHLADEKEKHGPEKLPVELLAMIMDDVSDADVLTLRSTSRRMDDMTWEYVGKRSFSTIRVPLSRAGLTKITNFVNERPRFRQAFTHLELQAGIHTPSAADLPAPLTRRQRKALAKQAHQKAKQAEAAAKKKREDGVDAEAMDTTPDGEPATRPVMVEAGQAADGSYVHHRKHERGPALPTSSLTNADAHTGKLFSSRVIRKCISDLLPSITSITIQHTPPAGAKQRERSLWVGDHRRASAEVEALLRALATHPLPHLRRLCIAPTRFADRDWDEGLVLLANLRNVTEDASALAALAPSFARLDHFALAVNTNTLDDVDAAAYTAVPALLRLMPALSTLGLAVSRRSRRTYPALLLRAVASDGEPCLRNLRRLSFDQFRFERRVFERFVDRHAGTLETLRVQKARVFEVWAARAQNHMDLGDWGKLLETMRERTGLAVVAERNLKLEVKDNSLVQRLVMHKTAGKNGGEKAESEKIHSDERDTEEMET